MNVKVYVWRFKMKKIFILFAFVLCSSIMVFAQVDNASEASEPSVDEKKSGFAVFAGDIFSLESGRLSNYRNISSNHLETNCFSVEAGTFTSNEDGLIDFVSGNYGGLYFGEGCAQNTLLWNNNGVVYSADDTAKFGSIYSRNEIGLQVNLLCLSAGGFIGLRSGYDLLYQGGTSVSGDKTSIFEHTFYSEAISGLYVSANIGKNLKIFAKYTTDVFPILSVRFDKAYYGYNANTTVSEINWFGPIEFDNSLVIGAVFFLES